MTKNNFGRKPIVGWVVFLILVFAAAMLLGGCAKGGSSVYQPPDPVDPPPAGPADAEVTFTWTPPAGTSCATSDSYYSSHRAHLNTFHWPTGYNLPDGLDMTPHGVAVDGSGGYHTATAKVKNSVQSNGSLLSWEFDVIDECANGSGAVDDDNITVQVQGCPGKPVSLPDMGRGGGALHTALYLVTPCGVGATVQQAEANAQSGGGD